MEDASSLKSSDSAGTSEEYEIVGGGNKEVPEQPQLNIANNGNMDDLQHQLDEVMKEKQSNSNSPSDQICSTTQSNDIINKTSEYNKDENRINKTPDQYHNITQDDKLVKDSNIMADNKYSEESTKMTCVSEKQDEIKIQSDTISKELQDKEMMKSAEIEIVSETNNVCDIQPDSRGTGANNPTFTQHHSDDETLQNASDGGGGDYTIFNRVMYLGAASINAPRSEAEIQRNMAILNEQAKEQALEVSISVPSDSEGHVIIYDASTSTEMTGFKIHRILFCARGKVDTEEARCFAFTSSHGDTQETAIFQCHVFRCQIPEAVARVLITFAAAFKRVPKSMLLHKQQEKQKEKQTDLEFLFDISLEIKEEDSKGNFSHIPRDKEFFKLRSNTEKQLILTVGPAPPSNTGAYYNNDLVVERCFGLLVSPGRKVKNADMNLLEMVSMGSSGTDKSYVISGHWDPADPAFVVLNDETPKDMRVHMTVAIDLVMRGIQEPVRFVTETKVRVYPHNERFWYFSKKPLIHLFSLKLKQVERSPSGENQYVVTSVDNLGEVERMRPSSMGLSLNLSSLTSSTLSSISSGRSPSIASIDTPGQDEDTDDDEPLLSGSGEVSKDCPPGQLDEWRQVLPKWQSLPGQMPKGMSSLVKRGIPEALRGEVWQLLCGCSDDQYMMDTYKVLITKDCPSEQVILRDINRTFPAHEYFKEAGGNGQDSLFKISKAYAVYDEEVGYCQGLSFLAAALLLHMPEEQTFCVLTKVMFEYGLRDLFKENFEILHMRFFQLGRLMEEQLPDLCAHFRDQGVEIHMFASQWFLTLYTAKFPLFMVFHYLDIFLLTGVDSAFQVALALLTMSKKELLSSDFEGILKYFRVQLPKKYRNEDTARQLFKLATSIKVKKIKKYEKEYLTMKEQEAIQEDPVIRLERENRRLLEDNMRLERENDDLAHELVTSKISMRHSMDVLEDKSETLKKDNLSVRSLLNDAEEEKKRLTLEATQVKEMLKREVEKGESETQRNNGIISDYKGICTQLSERLDKELAANAATINMYKTKVANCELCSGILSPVTGPPGELGEQSPAVTQLTQQIRELELELAQTKLALVESECKNQDLTHQLNSAVGELQSSRNTWFQKTITTIKERTTSVSSNVPGGGGAMLQTQLSKEEN